MPQATFEGFAFNIMKEFKSISFKTEQQTNQSSWITAFMGDRGLDLNEAGVPNNV